MRVPAQTTPELLFYRRDLFAEAGFGAAHHHRCTSERGARVPRPVCHGLGTALPGTRPVGTALGHTVLMTAGGFRPAGSGHLPEIAGGFDTDRACKTETIASTIDTEARPARRRVSDGAAEVLAAGHPVDVVVRTDPPLCRRHASRWPTAIRFLPPYFELDPVVAGILGRPVICRIPAGPGATRRACGRLCDGNPGEPRARACCAPPSRR